MTKSQFIAQRDTLQQQLPWGEIVVDKEIFSDFAIGCFLMKIQRLGKCI